MAPKQRKKKIKLVLDTSIQLEKIKNPEYSKNFKTEDYDLYTLHFVEYEFRTGFIRSLIDFYFRVERSADPATAKAKLSNSFKIREVKNFAILESIIDRLSTRIALNRAKKEDYLRMIEAAIFSSLQSFDLPLKQKIGSFAGDSIVRFPIFDRDDYFAFSDHHNSRKVIPLEDFWNKNKESLSTLAHSVEPYQAKNNTCKKDYTKLHALLSTVDGDVKESSKEPINKKMGDSVIVTDSPSTFALGSTDCVFTVLGGLLDKSIELHKPS